MTHPRVLFADHDRGYLESLSLALSQRKNLSFEVALSSETPKAMSLPAGQYDALVGFVEKTDQIEIFIRLKNENAGRPLVILVPPSDKALADEARRAGADGVLIRNANPKSTADLLNTSLSLLLNSRETKRLAAEARQKSKDLREAIGEKRRLVEVYRSLVDRPVVYQYPVLVVEDDEVAASLLGKALEQAGFRSPQMAACFDDALAFLSGDGEFGNRERFPLPFLLFLDLRLPGKSGFDVLQWLRSRREFQQIIVLAYSVSENPEDIRRAYELGANSYLTKPSTLEELQQVATAVRQFWVRQNV